jgi:hypothetical protein
MKNNTLQEEIQVKQEKFALFMNLIGLSERTILNYLESIRTCTKIISFSLEKRGYNSIYDVISAEEMRYFQQLLEKNPEYLTMNKRGNNRYSAGISNYIKYLDFLYIFGKKK